MKRGVAIILIFINLLLFSGCWDMKELNEVALVMAVGIDKGKDEGTFDVSVQIARPSSGNKGNEGASGSEPVYTAKAEGKTIFEAVRNLAKFTSRRISWAHNNVIIIGESLARDNITPVVDFFTHNQELRMKTIVSVAHGNASDYIAAKTGMENIPAMSLSSIFRCSQISAEIFEVDMTEFFRDFLSDTVESVAPGLDFKERGVSTGQSQEHGSNNQVELSGAAIFKGTRMAGWLNPEESIAISVLRNQFENSVVVAYAGADKKNKASVELRGAKSKIDTKMTGEVPTVNIKVTAKGMISEQDKPSELSMEEFKSQCEESLSKEIKERILLGVEKVQKEYKTDTFGFGRMVHIQHRNEWYEKYKNNWAEIYPTVPVNVDVKVDINSSYLYQIPIKVEKAGE